MQTPDDNLDLSRFENILQRSGFFSEFYEFSKSKSFDEAISIMRRLDDLMDQLDKEIKQELEKAIRITSNILDPDIDLSKSVDFIFRFYDHSMTPIFLSTLLCNISSDTLALAHFAFYSGYQIVSSADCLVAAQGIFTNLVLKGLIEDIPGNFVRFSSIFQAGATLRDHIDSNKLSGFIHEDLGSELDS